MVLEATTSYDCSIWHAFFGLPGYNNDINILHKLSLFKELKYENTPAANITISGNQYNIGYFLADGIYPAWSTLVQPYDEMLINGEYVRAQQLFNKKQIACRKDVERAFEIFKRKFHIICGSYRSFKPIEMNRIMLACIIFDNMVIEETRPDKSWVDYPDKDLRKEVQPAWGVPAREYRMVEERIQNRGLHLRLREDLTAHFWDGFGRRNLHKI
ncbi:uncharacterized protein LOC113315555 [Papaver somniferum]|uniref:uncharacterized protein LOC113315555 n=1 Tax=Papaver somniferum TaxID=3469 RepID=UPI000E6F4858|nr:uncharacterized protein LOC113315555 [Papaver somniferum]